MEKIKSPVYCDKKTGNQSKCACFATHKVKVQDKKGKLFDKHRCENHKYSKTVHKSVISSDPIDQSDLIEKLKLYLKSLVGKQIKSRFHRRDKILLVQYYVKNGAVMCINPHTRKYKLVYYSQIEIL